jgi:hypothetical protein
VMAGRMGRHGERFGKTAHAEGDANAARRGYRSAAGADSIAAGIGREGDGL